MKRKNLTGLYESDFLELCEVDRGDRLPHVIALVSNSGMLSFQFNMTRAQAIEIAAALVEFATQDDEVTA